VDLFKKQKVFIKYAIAALLGFGLGLWITYIFASGEIYMYPEKFGLPQRPLPFDSPETSLFNEACNYYFLLLCITKPHCIIFSTGLITGLFHVLNGKLVEHNFAVSFKSEF